MVNTLVDHPVLLIFVVLGIGSAAGAVKVRGVSLGPAGALFAGLALSGVDERLAIPEIVGTVGLALFTYTIGLASGPAFFPALRAHVKTIVAVCVVLVIAAATTKVIAEILGLDDGLRAGLFAGSLTNTPALAAAQEALKGSSEPVVAYSVAYPVGVIGMILATAWAIRLGRRSPNADDRDTPAALVAGTVRVRADLHVPVEDLVDRFGGEAVFSRVERDGNQLVPDLDFVIRPDDLVSVVSPQTVLDEVVRLLGEPVADRRLTDDRSRLDMRRIVVSDRRLTGCTLADLDLHGRFGAVATRVRRGDVDLLAHDDVVVQTGDRLRVVAPRERLGEVAKFLGDSERRTAEFDPVGFMVGIALGVGLGLVRVPLFGSGHFSLGTAGGPLIAGLIVGRIERTGPIVWQPSYGANLAIRQLGTLVFLGTVGSRAGSSLVDALSSRAGAKLAAGAVAVVAVAATCMVVAGRRLLGLGGARLAGTLAAYETQPAVLAFAGEQLSDERVGTAYALVFPVAMVLKIVLAQVIALL